MNQPASPFSDSSFAIKAVLIDLDGTMIHSAPEIARAANTMLAAMQLPALPLPTVQNFIGEGALALIKRCLFSATATQPDEHSIEIAKTLFFDAYTQLAPQSQPFDHVESGLDRYRSLGLPIACITNKPKQFTDPILKASGLAPYFDLVISGDTLRKKKPDPDQILHACREFAVEPWEAVLIGDSNTDILAAKNAGCYVFTVPYGYNQGLTIDSSQVDASILDLNDAINYFQT